MFRSIVVGTDGSLTATQAVERAAEMAAGWKAEVHLVSAHPPASGARVGGGSSPPAEAADWMPSPDFKAEAVLERAAGIVRLNGIEPTLHAPRGDPAEALIEVAEEHRADLIVVGSQGMSGARRLLGSVPNTVSHKAPCSVLIVHTAPGG